VRRRSTCILGSFNAIAMYYVFTISREREYTIARRTRRLCYVFSKRKNTSDILIRAHNAVQKNDTIHVENTTACKDSVLIFFSFLVS